MREEIEEGGQWLDDSATPDELEESSKGWMLAMAVLATVFDDVSQVEARNMVTSWVDETRSIHLGGPGATAYEGGDFTTIIDSIDRLLFAYPDDTIVLPGHGSDTTIGTERPHLQEWVDRGW